jgi:hypothetical protein
VGELIVALQPGLPHSIARLLEALTGQTMSAAGYELKRYAN